MFPQLRATRGPLLYCFSQAISTYHLKKGLREKVCKQKYSKVGIAVFTTHNSNLPIHGNYPELIWCLLSKCHKSKSRSLRRKVSLN